ncbi:hypothetical protein GCM10010420_15310 [Streptomyces glaucosporus]|uniref:DNA helicase DnaB-like N-terminal domain-containing protein n=1 Tax=Streptomyces glaucosporus TaxID=284044 RepID=A0ABN3I1H0_9ACTN
MIGGMTASSSSRVRPVVAATCRCGVLRPEPLSATSCPVCLVSPELTRRGELAHVGGAGYLHVWTQAVPTAATGPHYAEIVRAKAYRRGVIEAAQRILTRPLRVHRPDGASLADIGRRRVPASVPAASGSWPSTTSSPSNPSSAAG